VTNVRKLKSRRKENHQADGYREASWEEIRGKLFLSIYAKNVQRN